MKKNNLDEAQEQKMLKIEHNAYGIAFWGLLAAVIIQQFLGESRSTMGELVVFLTMCIYVAAACIKNGIWDRKLKPSRKANLLASLAAGIVVGILQFAQSYHNYGHFYGSIAAGILTLISTTVLCFAALALTTRLYKKRVQKLEEEIEE